MATKKTTTKKKEVDTKKQAMALAKKTGVKSATVTVDYTQGKHELYIIGMDGKRRDVSRLACTAAGFDSGIFFPTSYSEVISILDRS